MVFQSMQGSCYELLKVVSGNPDWVGWRSVGRSVGHFFPREDEEGESVKRMTMRGGKVERGGARRKRGERATVLRRISLQWCGKDVNFSFLLARSWAIITYHPPWQAVAGAVGLNVKDVADVDVNGGGGGGNGNCIIAHPMMLMEKRFL
jgi:hypothetical protein